MQNLFENYNTTILEKFEIIFDRAISEETALSNALDYYMILLDKGIQAPIDEIIEIADNYGFDFSDFESKLQSEI